MKRMGIFLIILTIILWFIDRLTGILSSACCHYFCGEIIYREPFDAIDGDASCGFYADIYIAMGLVLIFIVGIVMVRSAKQEDAEDTNTTDNKYSLRKCTKEFK